MENNNTKLEIKAFLDKDEQKAGHQKRKLNIPEILPFPGSVQPGVLQVFPWDSVQPGEEKDDVVAAVLPEIEKQKH